MASKMANFRGFLTLDLATAKMRMEKVGLPNGDESHGTIRKKITQLNKSKLPEKHRFFETINFWRFLGKKIGDTPPHISLQ